VRPLNGSRATASLLLAGLVVAQLLVACGRAEPPGAPSSRAAHMHGGPTTEQPSPSTRAPARRGPVSRIAVIVMENHEYDAIIGSSQAPYLNGLAKRSALLTGYDAVTHPSLPNYLAMTGGATFGIHSDCACVVTARNLVDQLELAHISWKGYMESMPRSCFFGDAYPYAQKHNPFIHYQDIRENRTRCERIVPFGQLATDERADRLPRFMFITPNLCHDMHDCSVRTGDAWLASVMPTLLPHLGPDGILVVTFDEGSTDAGCCVYARGGHIVAIIAGPGARTGVRLGRAADHYSLLRLIEDNWSLRRMRHAGCGCTPSIAGWRT
jgi:phosphatidylinositol-3-phosphatase